LAAAEAGADYVGFNFVPQVRRCLPENTAREIIRVFRMSHGHNGPQLVGIFVDQPLDEMNRIIKECDLDMAQLSGQEPINSCLYVDRPVIKAVHVPIGQPVEMVVNTLDSVLTELDEAGILPLLDPDVLDGPGGTGHSFDWTIATKLAPRHKFLLAGGLSPENVRQAVREVHPWGVDVSSGVETDGIKDPAKIIPFVQEARAAAE